jgi:hypothetical protein
MVEAGSAEDTHSNEPPPKRAAAPALTYDPPAAGTVSVRGFRMLVVLTLVNTVLLGSMVLGPQLFPFARQQWQRWKDDRAAKKLLAAELAIQRLCQSHQDPAARVVYEEDPAKALELIKASPRDYEGVSSSRPEGPPGWFGPIRAVAPDHYLKFLSAAYGRIVSRANETLLFLHERATPGGVRSIVVVRLRLSTSFGRQAGSAEYVRFTQRKERQLEGNWWPIGTGGPTVDARGKGRTIGLSLWLPDQRESRVVAEVKANVPIETPPAIDYGNKLRVYAGQPDPADASHFTIDYEIDGRRGVIDGWLRDQGLELRPREGAFTYDARYGEAWRLPAAGPTEAPVEAAPAAARDGQ